MTRYSSNRDLSLEPFVGDLKAASIAPEMRPPNLVSPLDAAVWHFDIDLKPFPWRRMMANGQCISAPRNAGFFDLARRYYTIFSLNMVSYSQIERSTAAQKTYTLLYLMDRVIGAGYRRFSDTPPSFWANFRSELAMQKKLGVAKTVGRIAEYYKTLMYLNYLLNLKDADGRHLLSDGIPYSIFTSFSHAQQEAKLFGVSSEPTGDIPSEVCFSYIDAALEYIDLHAHHILELDAGTVALDESDAASTRLLCGQVDQLMASLVLKCAGTVPDRLLYGDTISFSAIGKEISASISAVSRGVSRSLVEEWEAVHASGDKIGRARLISRCEIIVRNFEDQLEHREKQRIAAARRKRQRTSDDCFPFYGPPGKWLRYPILARYARKCDPAQSLEVIKSNLWSACYLVIVAFVATRSNEAMSLFTDCLGGKLIKLFGVSRIS